MRRIVAAAGPAFTGPIPAEPKPAALIPAEPKPAEPKPGRPVYAGAASTGPAALALRGGEVPGAAFGGADARVLRAAEPARPAASHTHRRTRTLVFSPVFPATRTPDLAIFLDDP
jgi:hypothetical protein